jgi:hypothetical protein
MIDNEANPRGINTSSVCGASNTATARSRSLKVTATTRSDREYMKAMPQLKALAQKYGCEIEKYEIRFEYESGAPDSTPVYLVYVNGKFLGYADVLRNEAAAKLRERVTRFAISRWKQHENYLLQI